VRPSPITLMVRTSSCTTNAWQMAPYKPTLQMPSRQIVPTTIARPWHYRSRTL